jgi:hypothetical protein
MLAWWRRDAKCNKIFQNKMVSFMEMASSTKESSTNVLSTAKNGRRGLSWLTMKDSSPTRTRRKTIQLAYCPRQSRNYGPTLNSMAHSWLSRSNTKAIKLNSRFLY